MGWKKKEKIKKSRKSYTFARFQHEKHIYSFNTAIAVGHTLPHMLSLAQNTSFFTAEYHSTRKQ